LEATVAMPGPDNSDWQSAIKNIARELDIGLLEAEDTRQLSGQEH
jgi:hypothetical protein